MKKMVDKKGRKLVDQTPKDDDEVYFGVWGEENKRDEKSFVFEEGKPYDVTMLSIRETDKGYRYIYKVQVPNVDKPVLIFGNTSLNSATGRGSFDVKTIEEGDDIRITYEGKYKSKKTGRSGYKIKVQVWE